jgi:hypothetical protein
MHRSTFFARYFVDIQRSLPLISDCIVNHDQALQMQKRSL